MLFIDATGWSELARLNGPPTMQTLGLLLIALMLMPVALRFVGPLFRLGFIAAALLVPVYFVMPIVQ